MLHDYIFRHHPGCAAVHGAEASLGAVVRWFFSCFHYFFFFFFLNYLFMVCTGAYCCLRTFSSCAEQELLLVAVCGLLIGVASLVAEHDLLGRQASVVVASELSSCGTWALLPRGTWNLPRPGIEPVSPALAGRFLTSGPPGKSYSFILTQTFPRFILFIV